MLTIFYSISGYLIDLGKSVVVLCNDNAGFISAILAVIAIVISVKIGRFPYQKKLSFYHYLSSDETEELIATVYVSNVGNCPVYLDELVAKEGYFKTIGRCEDISNTLMIEDRLLEPKKTYIFKIPLKGYKWTSQEKRRPLRFVLTTGRKKFSYRANWGIG